MLLSNSLVKSRKPRARHINWYLFPRLILKAKTVKKFVKLAHVFNYIPAYVAARAGA